MSDYKIIRFDTKGTTETFGLYEATAKDKAIPSICQKKEDETFTENEEDTIVLFLPSAEGNCILPHTTTVYVYRRRKNVNGKLAKEVCSEAISFGPTPHLRWYEVTDVLRDAIETKNIGTFFDME